MSILLQAIALCLQPVSMLLMIGGTVAGTIFGALPGISASMGVALMLPFTYRMAPLQSMILLTSVYCSAITGGGITAILFKIPGTPSSAVTVFDGYTMAQKGQVGKALGTAFVASAIGGIFSSMAMLLVSPQLASWALRFGPHEYFAVAFLGLSVLSSLDEGNMIKTLIAGFLGLALATIGMDPMDAVPRFTFGTQLLTGGVPFVPVMIGAFAITQVLKETSTRLEKLEKNAGITKVTTALLSLKEIWALKATLLRGSLIGTLIGILPGAGATIASFVAYGVELKSSKTPQKFGTGIMEGIAAPESANNAATGGAMVPLLALGIPGGGTAAIMLAALLMQGVQPGPLMVRTQPMYLNTIFITMMIVNVLMVFVAMAGAKAFAKILALPYGVLAPLILLLSAIGSFAMNNDIAHVWIMLAFGVFGYFMQRYNFSASAMVLGLVLGDICEPALRRAVMVSDGNISTIFTRPISGTIMAVSILALVYPLIKDLINKSRRKAQAA